MNEQVPFSFELRPAEKLLRITLTGHWDLATVEAYRRAREKTWSDVRAKGISPGALRMLVDRRGQLAQSLDVVDAVGRVIADSGSHASRTAVLVSSMLHKRQVDRTAPASARSFTDEREALEWLNGQ